MEAKQVFYEGHVQGVGFRYTVKQVALGFEIAGWVRNLGDGRVELQVQSEEPDEVPAFLKAIRDSGVGGNIRGEEIHEIAPDAEARGFRIR